MGWFSAPEYWLGRLVLERGVAAVYLIAFVGAAAQFRALIGEHGILPVPAPATTELLKGKPVYSAGPAIELTTPTGAAILSALASGFGPMPALRVETQGFGAGDKDFPMMPNLLRVVIGTESAAAESTLVTVIEANIDDSTPEVLGFAMERLLAAGALDVTLQPLQMKKGRPGSLLSVLVKPEDTESLVAIVFRETTTLGVRFYEARRIVQERKWFLVETRFGKVRVKRGERGGFAPEYEDCRRLALSGNVALREVMADAASEFLKGNSVEVES